MKFALILTIVMIVLLITHGTPDTFSAYLAIGIVALVLAMVLGLLFARPRYRGPHRR